MATCNIALAKHDYANNSILIERKGELLNTGGELIIRITIPYQNFILDNINYILTTVSNSLPNWYSEQYTYQHWLSNTLYQKFGNNNSAVPIKNKIYHSSDINTKHTYLTIRKNIKKTLTYLKTCISYLDDFNLIDEKHKEILKKVEIFNSTVYEEDINSNYYRRFLERNKRGLLNVFGEGLKFLFGVATEEDVQKVNEKIKRNNLNIHLSKYKITAITSKVNELINHTSDSIKVIQDKVNEIHDLQTLASYLNQYNTAWATLSTEAEFLYINSIILEQKINLLQKGIVISDILRKEELTQLIKEGHREFPNLIFPISNITKQNFPKYLEIVTLVPTESNYQYLLKIPFVRRTKFELYELHPFPTFTINKMPVIPVIKKFIAKANNRELFKIYPSSKNFKKYSYDNETYFLDSDSSNDISNLNLCEIKVLEKLSQPKILEFCNYTKIELTGGIYSINLNGWYIFFESETPASIKCTHEEYFADLVHFNYFPPECTIKTKYNTFTSSLNHYFTSINNTGFQPKIINYILPEINSTKHHELFRIKDNVTLLKTYNEDINEMNTYYHFNMIHTLSNSVGLLIFSIITISLLILVCKLYHTKVIRNNPINERVESVSMHSI